MSKEEPAAAGSQTPLVIAVAAVTLAIAVTVGALTGALGRRNAAPVSQPAEAAPLIPAAVPGSPPPVPTAPVMPAPDVELPVQAPEPIPSVGPYDDDGSDDAEVAHRERHHRGHDDDDEDDGDDD